MSFTLEERLSILSCHSVEELHSLSTEMGWGEEMFSSALKLAFGELQFKLLSPSRTGIYDDYLESISRDFEDKRVVEKVDSSVKSLVRRLSRKLNNLTDRSGYGIVIGRIQSGKTANMLGLAYNCLDNNEGVLPYSFDTVIVLSGLIDDLRKQTFERCEEYEINKVKLTPDGKDLTQNKSAREKIIEHLNSTSGSKMIIITKKHPKTIEKLRNLINQTNRDLLQSRSFLIIDDECDHASIDSSNSESLNDDVDDAWVTATNSELRLLIKATEQTGRLNWYVGYTATPYSNLLMNPDPDYLDETLGLTLFPRDFIYSLPKPTGHLDNYDYFVRTSGNVKRIIAPEPGSSNEFKRLTEVVWLHLATNILKKRVRLINDHHTSLIHTNVGTDEHNRVASLVADYIDTINDYGTEQIVHQLKKCVNEEFNLSEEEEGSYHSLLESMASNDGSGLFRLLGSIRVVELNRRDRLSIEEDESLVEISQELAYKGKKKSLIVVGGTRLSRGLTLKGLTISYFTRTASTPMYDTMLQMARWCGYRSKYEDLVRIMTDSDTAERFRRIALVEQDLRDDLDDLSDDSDPMEEIFWIRKYDSMNITGRMPLQPRRKYQGGVTKSQLWTLFPNVMNTNDPLGVNRQTYSAFDNLYNHTIFPLVGSDQSKPPKGEGNYRVVRGVDRTYIHQFLDSYLSYYSKVCQTENTLRKFMENDISKFEKWNLAINIPKKKTTASFRGKKLVDRKGVSENELMIIHSGNEVFKVDLEDGEARVDPLLVLYLANQNYTVNDERVFPIGLSRPVVLFGIILSDSSLTGAEYFGRAGPLFGGGL